MSDAAEPSRSDFAALQADLSAGCLDAGRFERYRLYLLRLAADIGAENGQPAFVTNSDLVSEVFARVLAHLPTFEGRTEAEFIGWLRGILVHLAQNQRRDWSRQRRGGGKRSSSLREGLTTDPHPTPCAESIQAEQVARLRQLIERLPERERVAVERRRIHGHSFEEIAAATGRSVASLRKDVGRGLRMLKELLDAEGE